MNFVQCLYSLTFLPDANKNRAHFALITCQPICTHDIATPSSSMLLKTLVWETVFHEIYHHCHAFYNVIDIGLLFIYLIDINL